MLYTISRIQDIENGTGQAVLPNRVLCYTLSSQSLLIYSKRLKCGSCNNYPLDEQQLPIAKSLNIFCVRKLKMHRS